jgi:hypothetical protein
MVYRTLGFVVDGYETQYSVSHCGLCTATKPSVQSPNAVSVMDIKHSVLSLNVLSVSATKPSVLYPSVVSVTDTNPSVLYPIVVSATATKPSVLYSNVVSVRLPNQVFSLLMLSL